MLEYKQIPTNCIICNSRLIWDTQSYFDCSENCGFCGVIKSPLNKFSYVQFNFKDLEAGCNFNFKDKTIDIYIDTKKFSSRPMDLDFNKYDEWKDEIRNYIIKYMNFI